MGRGAQSPAEECCFLLLSDTGAGTDELLLLADVDGTSCLQLLGCDIPVTDCFLLLSDTGALTDELLLLEDVDGTSCLELLSS